MHATVVHAISHLPQGAITEILGAPGSGKTEAVLRFLAAHPELRAAWIEEDFTIYPCAFPQHGVELSRVFFVDVGVASNGVGVGSSGAGVASKDSALWAAHQILASQLFGAIVLSARIQDLVALRRLQLAAEKNQARVILLSEVSAMASVGNAWPIRLQLQASRTRAGEPVLTVLRSRGGEDAWRTNSA